MRVRIVRDAPGVRVPRLALVTGVVLAVLGLAVAASLSVTEGPVICPLRAVTGLPCPSCGLLRSTNAILLGHVGTAFATNPLDTLFLLVVVPVMIAVWAVRMWRRVAVIVEFTRRERRLAWTALIVAVAINWAYVLATHT